MVWMRCAALGAVVLGVAGCGGGSSTTPATTPTQGFEISNLHVQTVSPAGLAFTVDFVDPATIGATALCNGATNLGQVEIPIVFFVSGTGTTSTSGTVQCETNFNAPATAAVSGTLNLTDSSGNLSNSLTFSAALAETARPRS